MIWDVSFNQTLNCLLRCCTDYAAVPRAAKRSALNTAEVYLSIHEMPATDLSINQIIVLRPICHTGSNEIQIQKMNLKTIFNSIVNGAQLLCKCLGSRLWSSGFFMVGQRQIGIENHTSQHKLSFSQIS